MHKSDEVVEVGGAAFGPPADVMDLQVGVSAAGCGAFVALAGQHGTALTKSGQPVSASDVEDFVVAGPDRCEVDRAGQVVEQLGADGPEPGELGWCVTGGVDDDRQMWADTFV